MSFTVTIQNPYPKTTVKQLLEEYFLIPRKIRHFLRIKKHVLINGAPINWQTSVDLGDQITLTFDSEDYPQKEIPFGDPRQVETLYEDEHLIIVNKPEGMKTHGNEPTEIALLNHVSAFVGKTCYVVHRLDMETSGAILFAKNPFILPILNRLLENKAIKRQYWALVEGQLPQKTVTYNKPIGRHRHDRRKRVVDHRNGQIALTHVTVLKQFKQASLINCQLETGRTHQIRVHLSHDHHPIIGDPLYHPNPKGRLLLHAHKLSITHPLTLQPITVQAKSQSFDAALSALK